jgi:hypothetical protein
VFEKYNSTPHFVHKTVSRPRPSVVLRNGCRSCFKLCATGGKELFLSFEKFLLRKT